MPRRNILLFVILAFLLIVSCRQAPQEQSKSDKRLKVIATIYPLYDFARAVGGDKVNISMLLPPATDAHHFELKPNDIIRVSKAEIFLFTSFDMEQWAYKIINASAEKTNMMAVEAGQGVHLLSLHPSDVHADADHPAAPEPAGLHAMKYDPHVWLDFDNARIMIDNIAKAFINKDPKNSEYYKANAHRYKQSLMDLDRRYRTQLSNCQTRTILHAGHWAFAYLAQRYNIRYIAAYNASADAEPTPQQIMSMIGEVKSRKIPYIFYEDLTVPRLAQTLSQESGADLLQLNNGHDISAKDMQRGETFITLMDRNLTQLKKGMQCR